MNWFEKLTGFPEKDWTSTRALLKLNGTCLTSLENGKSYNIGQFQLASLSELRERCQACDSQKGPAKVSIVTGDVRAMHRKPENIGALFQVASQFNMLEMVRPSVTPEQGVGRYENDHTQGPACAIAAGAATIYRNYLVPVDDNYGQTEVRQLDGLSSVGRALADRLQIPSSELWTMKNGYAFPTPQSLELIGSYLRSLNEAQRDAIRERLCIGLQTDVEVTDVEGYPGPLVSQAFCSALPIAYSNIRSSSWEPFALLVLEAAYEATLCAAVLNAKRGASNIVFLTFLGGGAFGNEDKWIHDAIERAVGIFRGYELDIRLVSYGAPSPPLIQLAARIEL